MQIDSIDWGTLSQTHDVRMTLTLHDGLPSGKITVKPKPIHQSQTTTPADGPPASSSEPDNDAATKAACNLLLSLGVDARTSKGLAIQHGFHRVEAVIQSARGKSSPSGFAVDALKKGWNVRPPKPTNGDRR